MVLVCLLPGGCSINTGHPGNTQISPSWKEFCMLIEQLSGKDNRPYPKDNDPSPKDNCPSRKPRSRVRTLVFPEGCFKLEFPSHKFSLEPTLREGRSCILPGRPVFMEQPPGYLAASLLASLQGCARYIKVGSAIPIQDTGSVSKDTQNVSLV